MNLSAITDRVREYLLDLPQHNEILILDWINLAIRSIEDRHNFEYMQQQANFTTSEGARTLGPKPERWKAFREDPYIARADGSNMEIDWAASHSDMVRQYGDSEEHDSGPPRFVLEKVAGLDVYPLPDGRGDYSDGEYRIRIPYWAYSPTLHEQSSEVNWLMANYPWYIISAAVAEGMIFNRDEARAATFVGLSERERARAIATDKRSKLPRRMELTPRGRVFGPGRSPRRSFRGW